MPRYIAFLRAINVGGRVVPMERLRARFESLGFAAVETFIASGNVIFASPGPPAALERRIEASLAADLGYEVATFLRTDAEVAAIAARPALPAPGPGAEGALNVAFLHAAPGPAARRALAAHRSATDDFRIAGREVYWRCAGRQSGSRFSNAALERALGMPATLRGISTLRKLAAKFPPAAARAAARGYTARRSGGSATPRKAKR